MKKLLLRTEMSKLNRVRLFPTRVYNIYIELGGYAPYYLNLFPFVRAITHNLHVACLAKFSFLSASSLWMGQPNCKQVEFLYCFE